MKTVTKPEEEAVKIRFFSGLRDPETKPKLLDVIKAKPASCKNWKRIPKQGMNKIKTEHLPAAKGYKAQI